MTSEPGDQNQPVEAPVMASSAEQQAQPEATPAALQVQILATEHWSLLATRSQTWNESFARAQKFLSVLAASVIALALVAQASAFGRGFTAFALVRLPVVLFLGLTTYIRLVAVNHDEVRWVLGMNRIRVAYLELAPELERWFITSRHDDEKALKARVQARGPTRPIHQPGSRRLTKASAAGGLSALLAAAAVRLAPAISISAGQGPL